MKNAERMILKQRLTWMYVVLLLLFIIAQSSITIIYFSANFITESLAAKTVWDMLLSQPVILPVMRFILTLTGLYLLYFWCVRYLALSVTNLFNMKMQHAYITGLIIFFFCCLGLVSLNAEFYPESVMSQFVLMSPFVAKVNVWFAYGFIYLTIMLLLLAGVDAWFNNYHYIQTFFITTLVLSTTILTVSEEHLASVSKHENNGKTNIILIGIDSLRPDYVSLFNRKAVPTPNINKFLQESVRFSQAYTPLARTFPSWMSVLTGKYPLHNHVRVNLQNPADFQLEETLAKRLQQAGYQTIYATDEKRFSNITKEYGFDQIIGPPIGARDFLIGGMGDMPISNLLVNTFWGKFLFPDLYANRAAKNTYIPESFMNMFSRQLAVSGAKPVFLAVHLCLTHWPFTWSNENKSIYVSMLPEKYAVSVAGVDKQFGELMQLLGKAGLLENSLVVLLSDHGTTLGLPGDRMVTKSNYVGRSDKIKLLPVYWLNKSKTDMHSLDGSFEYDTAYGHATDVLSLKQYNIVMAFRSYGKTFTGHEHSSRVSAIDVAPTVLDYLGLAPLVGQDGVSLLSALNGRRLSERPLFFETAIKVKGIESNNINIGNVLNQSIFYYRLNPENGHVYFNSKYLPGALKEKQRGVLFGDWLLVKYPAKSVYILGKNGFEEKRNPEFFALLNVKTGKWTIDYSAPIISAAEKKNIEHLLVKFYGKELA